MLIKYPIVVLLIRLALGGCDGDNHNGENSNGGTIKPTCVPNGELPDSQCLAEDLFNSCDLNFCGTSFPDIFVDFFFPNQLDRTDWEVTDCTTITCDDDDTIFTDLAVNDDGLLTGTVIRSNLEESPLESCTRVDPDID